jgi:ubiquinone/menaquinone biosynthesis C-methylase UbiE
MFLDKRNVVDQLERTGPVSIELGCGPSKINASAIGIDALDYECVDIVGDALDVLRRFPSNSVSHTYSAHFLEHLEEPDALLRELERIVSPGGELIFIVPHFSNPYFYSDYTHRSVFGLYTFSYLTTNSLFRRTVPTYRRSNKFDLVSVDLLFHSARPFYFRHVIKIAIGWIFNANYYLKEFYEENLCYVFPCYEIRYFLRKRT